MKQKTLMIFLSCAIGSGIGFLLAKEFGVLWILGILLGGLAGYIVYDFKQILSAIPVAFKYAVEKVENWNFAELARTSFRFGFLIFVAIGIPMLLFFLIRDVIFQHMFLLFPFLLYVITYSLLSTLLVISRYSEDSIPSSLTPEAKEIVRYIQFLDYKIIKKSRQNFLVLSLLLYSFVPLFTIYICFILILRFGVWVGKKVLNCLISIANFLSAFFWKLFKLVHSSERLLVATDSMLGGMIGFLFLDSILLSMLAGAVLGVVNYEVVSVRILKLKPKV